MIRVLSGLVEDPALRRRYVLTALGAMVVRAATVLLLFPLLTELFSAEPEQALPWMSALAVAVVAGWSVDQRLSRAGFAVGFSLLTSVERRVLDRVQRMPVTWLDPDRRSLVQRALATSGHELCTGVAYLFTPAITAIGSAVLVSLGLLVIDPVLGLVAVGSLVLMSLALGGRLTRQADSAYADASAEAGRHVVELARWQRVLRSAGQASLVDGRVSAALDRQARAARRLVRAAVPGEVVFGLVAQATLLALAVTAGWLAVDGALTPAETVAVVVVLVRFHEPFTSFAALGPALEGMRGALRRLDVVLGSETLPEPTSSASPTDTGVQLRGVTFRHEPDAPVVLDDVTLDVPAGSTTAIVGPSGSGKSTLLSLLARVGDVESGEVLVRGNDVRDYRLDDLLDQLGIVFQDVYLFDGTLRENVVLARPEASDDDIAAAAAAAQLDEVVTRLPQGWDTRVGEGGDLLSGGEKQRVSIARALLKNAPVLLLDEASSSLDTHNERALVAALRDAAPGRTTIVVAHRLETIAHADQIAFLEGGRIVERGTLDDLVAAGGRFADYWAAREAATAWALRP